MTAQTCGISIAHGTDETVCVITYFLQVFLLTSWCLTSGYDKMKIQFMKDYYDLRYEETDGENHFVDETAYQEKQSEQSKMEDQLMEMVGGSESNVWKLYESIMCVYFDMEEIIKQAVYLQGAYDRERMLK